MAYLSVNGMRSHRYPLAGCGGCERSTLGRVASALGLDVESAAFGGSVAAVGLGGLAFGGLVGYWVGKTFGGRVAANRRRRAR